MYISVLGVALVALHAVLAQGVTHNVAVGPNGTLTYDPPYVVAAVGDIINFTFRQKNHTATQSNFDTPCVPNGGFNSNFMPVADGVSEFPVFQVRVNDTNPIWVHCEQTVPRSHCGAGMVFAVNPPADPDPRSFTSFKNLAIGTNGTNTSSTSTTTDTFTTPPPQQWQTATATVSSASSVWTTTYTSYDGTPPPTFAPQPADHKITVGANGQLSYNPPNITAAIGDTVTFEFYPKNHTVTQSSFNDPCRPLADTSTSGRAGFDSQFMPVGANDTQFPQFRITINDTTPIWGYCRQTGPPVHCGAGMVFAINAVESGSNNFENFLTLAKRINGSSSPATNGSSAGSSPSDSGAPGGTRVSRMGVMGLGVVALMASLL